MKQSNVRATEIRLSSAQLAAEALRVLTDGDVKTSRRTMVDAALRDFVISAGRKVTSFRPDTDETNAKHATATALIEKAYRLTVDADEAVGKSELWAIIDGGEFPSIGTDSTNVQPKLFASSGQSVEVDLPERLAGSA